MKSNTVEPMSKPNKGYKKFMTKTDKKDHKQLRRQRQLGRGACNYDDSNSMTVAY